MRSLEPLGIAARVRVVDSAQYQARLTTYDYDMIQHDVALLAVAGQRAAVPLVVEDGGRARLVQLRGRQEPGRRRHDAGHAVG